MVDVYDFYETCVVVALLMSCVHVWAHVLMDAMLENNVGTKEAKRLRSETKRFLLKKECFTYIKEASVLYRVIKAEWWITVLSLLVTGIFAVIFGFGLFLTYPKYRIINAFLYKTVYKLFYIDVACFALHFILHGIYRNVSTPDQSGLREEIKRKQEYYGSKKASERFQWKLAPDDPSIPLAEREDKLGKNELRIRTVVLKLYDRMKQRAFLPYDGMTEELDDLYGRLVQIEQRCIELNLDFDVTYYGCNYWVFPFWLYTEFTKHYQMLKRGTRFSKIRQLRQMKKQIQYLGYNIAEAYDKSAQIQYYSELQLHDSEVALDLLKEMNQTLKHAARQTSNQKMEQWALEVDKAIAEISSMLENRKILVCNICRAKGRLSE